MTPEGKVKEKIKRKLEKLREAGVPLYSHMPVQNGMGAPSLDFICCIAGYYVGIEAKRPGAELTLRQRITCGQIAAAGGAWFFIDDSPESWATFDFWLEMTCHHQLCSRSRTSQSHSSSA